MTRIGRGLLLILLGIAMVRTPATPISTLPADRSLPSAITTVMLEGQVSNLTQTDGARGGPAITFTLDTNVGEAKVYLAPPDYAAQRGLSLKNGSRVQVVGLKMPQRKPVFVAMSLTVNNKTFVLRDDNGRPKWAVFLAPEPVTLKGIIKKVTIPPAVPTGTTPESQQPKVTFLLNSEKGLVKIVACPRAYTDAIRLELREGALITVSGWQRLAATAPSSRNAEHLLVIARDITIGTRVYSLRSAEGHPLWLPRPSTP